MISSLVCISPYNKTGRLKTYKNFLSLCHLDAANVYLVLLLTKFLKINSQTDRSHLEHKSHNNIFHTTIITYTDKEQALLFAS